MNTITKLIITLLWSGICLAGSHNGTTNERAQLTPEEECQKFGGIRENGSCKCGKYSVFPSRYEKCESGMLFPATVESITALKENELLQTNTKNPNPGYIVKPIGSTYLAHFPASKSEPEMDVCYSELSWEREKDDRVLPGGAGPSGGRTVCLAKNGKCPDPIGCFAEKKDLAELWEIKWLVSSFGPYKNVQQLKEDQTRSKFGCWVKAGEEYLYNEYEVPRLGLACDENLFDVRDKQKKLRGKGWWAEFLGCGDPAVVKKDRNAVRSCP